MTAESATGLFLASRALTGVARSAGMPAANDLVQRQPGGLRFWQTSQTGLPCGRVDLMGSGGTRDSQPQRDAGCAERVRRPYLERAPDEDELRAGVLHEIATEIARQCGHSLFKSYRLAWGWSVTEAVEAFHAMCRRDKLKPRGLVARSWLEWEAGGRPSWDYQDLLSRLFRANPVQLGWAVDYTPFVSPEQRPAAPAPVGAETRVPRPAASSAESGIVLSPAWQPAAGWRALLHLPADINDFTGRYEQADKASRLVTAEGGRANTAVPITVISGKAGIGKTALALHVAHKISDRFPDGQMYANLRGTEADALDPAEVLAGFLRELGVDGADIPERVDDRARMYRARLADRRVLVVLDNAADEAQVRPLLPGTAGCAVLVTSRSRMAALAGSQSVFLDVMPADQSAELLAMIIGRERAEAEAAAVKEITRLCGFLPLAIRIAGARLESRPAWRISWFAERLRDESRRLDLLKAGDLEVRASFALSYEGENADAQRAFRFAGIMPSDFPAWNLAALLGTDADHAEQLLEELVDAQLVEVIGVDATGLIRYGLHDLLRDFARERLAGSESAAVRREALSRLAQEFIDAARTGSAILQPGTTGAEPSGHPPLAIAVVQEDPQNWFTAERANLISLVRLVYDTELWQQTWHLTRALTVMLSWRADWRAWEQTHRLALDAARYARDEHAEATIRCSLGMLYRELGQYDEAAAMLTGASEAFSRLGDEHQRATALRGLGDTYRYQGLLEEAITAFSSALEVFRNQRDDRSIAGALNGMADAQRGLSRWTEAKIGFEECIAIYHQLDDPLEEARSTVRYAMVLRDRSLGDQAIPLLDTALKVFQDLGDRRWEARTLRHLAVLHRQEVHADTAFRLFRESLEIFDELADRRGTAVVLRNRGDTHRWAGAFGDADHDLRQAMEIFESIGDRRWSARTHLSIAGMRRAQQRWVDAAHHVSQALDVFRAISDRPAQARALRELGMLLRDQGEPTRAEAAMAESRSIFTALGDELWTARTMASEAKLYELDGKDPAGILAEAGEICRRNGVTSENRITLLLREW
jgi:tetratricopeptide (TPR) repeat protein